MIPVAAMFTSRGLAMARVLEVEKWTALESTEYVEWCSSQPREKGLVQNLIMIRRRGDAVPYVAKTTSM